VIAKQPSPVAMMRLSVLAPIVSEKAMTQLANQNDYGRKPGLGTGPFRLVSFDPGKGIELARNDNYKHGSACKPAAKIAAAQILPIPDAQTQFAQLMVGGLDITKISSKDEADALSANPDLRLSAIPDTLLHTVMFDAAGRSGNKALADVRVRRAIAHAINGEFIARAVMPGGTAIKPMTGVCAPVEVACEVGILPPVTDVARAKALLAEAGYANGFETEITALPMSFPLADAIAGELRKIGVRATVDKASFVSFRQKQADSKLQLIVSAIPISTALDASSTPAYYFEPGPRNYTGDPEMTKLYRAAITETDTAKRKPIFRAMNDRNNEQVYLKPLVSTPDVFVHTKDLSVDTNAIHPESLGLYDLSWN
jgi:peptide/nickel transport system substrate-binding protein